MKLKTFSALLLWAASALAYAQMPPMEAPGATAAPPYRTIAEAATEDRAVVRVFFLFSCSYCAQAHEGVVRWGASLPKGIQFRPTPVVTDRGSAIAAAYFYAVQRSAPMHVDRFVSATYAEIQQRQGNPADERTYLRAATLAGLDRDALARVVRSKAVSDATRRAVLLMGQYQLDSTPSITIGGKYVVTPDATMGVNSNFYELLNAVTSKYLIETNQGPT